ncbi:hypothetical protein ACF0H5_023874 [Mactra antiquata]
MFGIRCVDVMLSWRRLQFKCLILLLVWQTTRVAGQNCTDNQTEVSFNETSSRCCDVCNPGYGVSTNCSADENTQCQKCVPGITYSNSASPDEPCKMCSTCGNNTHFILHPCNETQNTICVCPSGSYYDPDADECKYCTLCDPGHGASTRCSATHNSKCLPCEINVTYSNKVDPYSPCKPCTVCRKDEVPLRNCSVYEDTICLSVTVGKGYHPSYNISTPTRYEESEDDNSNIIPVYCSVLGLVVVGLLGYVVIKHWKRMREKRRHKAPCSHEDVEYSKASGGDSGIFIENESPKNYTYCLNSRVRDLPQLKRTELEKTLSSPQSDSWKELAKELGYSSKRLMQFEAKNNNKNTNSAFKHLLHDWERRDIATVSHLIQCLRNIGREDAARLLYADSTEGRTQMVNNRHQNHV